MFYAIEFHHRGALQDNRYALYHGFCETKERLPTNFDIRLLPVLANVYPLV